MSFGLNKCAVLEMKWGRKQHRSGIELPNGVSKRELENVGYKNLEILQLDQTLDATEDESEDRGGVYPPGNVMPV